MLILFGDKMAEGILKFNLDIPEERELFKVSVHASDLFLMICAIEQKLRNEVKYKDNKQAEEVRDMIYEELSHCNLHLDMLS